MCIFSKHACAACVGIVYFRKVDALAEDALRNAVIDKLLQDERTLRWEVPKTPQRLPMSAAFYRQGLLVCHACWACIECINAWIQRHCGQVAHSVPGTHIVLKNILPPERHAEVAILQAQKVLSSLSQQS